jgi:hypothetical protein
VTRYADATDLDTYGALPAATSALFTTAQKNAALDVESAVADSYFASAGDVPLTTWGADLRAAVAARAAWRLLQGLRGFDAAAQGNSFKLAADEALKWYRDVAKGLAKVSSAAPSQSSGVRIETSEALGWYEAASAEDPDEC